MFLHGLQQVHQGEQVVFIVGKWLFNTFTHCFIGGKMDHGLNIRVFFKDGEGGGLIPQVHFFKMRSVR